METLAHCLMQQVQNLAPEFVWEELSLVLVGDEGIRDLNEEYFNKQAITDVISFAYPPEPIIQGDTGEVIINVAQAWYEGREREGPDRELALYIAHGCHHLMGAEDDTPAKKAAMLQLENQWVDDSQYQGLFVPEGTASK